MGYTVDNPPTNLYVDTIWPVSPGDIVEWQEEGETIRGYVSDIYSGLRDGTDPFTGRPREDRPARADVIAGGVEYTSHRVPFDVLTVVGRCTHEWEEMTLAGKWLRCKNCHMVPTEGLLEAARKQGTIG